MIFSKKSCTYSAMAKDVFDKKNVTYVVEELDTNEQCSDLQDILLKLTGARTVSVSVVTL